MNESYVDLEEIENGYIFASNDEISLLLPDWYDGESEYYEIVKNKTKEIVGRIIYHYNNDDITGNIEYEIYMPFKGNSYAKKALILLAENMYRLDKKDLYIAILPNNIASIKTAIGSGAIFEKKVEIPKHYKISHGGEYTYLNMYILKVKGENDEKYKEKHNL